MTKDPAAFVSMTVVEHRALTMLDGTRPAVDTPDLNERSTYVFVAASGGLMSWNNPEAVLLQQLLVGLAASGDVQVHLVNLDDAGAVVSGSEYLLRSYTAVTDVVLFETEFRVSVQQGQALRVTATQPGRCAVWVKIERGTVR